MAKKYANWDYFRLVDELDEGAEDPAKLIRDVLRSGLRLQPEEAIELIYYGTDAEKEILDAVDGSFEPDQVAELREYIGMDRLEELFLPKKTKNVWARQNPNTPGRNSSGLRNGGRGAGARNGGSRKPGAGNTKGPRRSPNKPNHSR